jgi:TonB family protein
MRVTSLLLVWLGAVCVLPAAAQDALEDAKSQYASAAYEDALATLDRASGGMPAARVEIEQYRAFCLIALGRTADAERAIAALVQANPTYVPSESVASPKVLGLVTEMRRKELPGVARRLLDDGRAAFDQKAFDRAQTSFDLLLQVLADPIMKARPDTDDMRVLAQGFTTLAAAVSSPASVATSGTANPAATPGSAPVNGDGNGNGVSGNGIGTGITAGPADTGVVDGAAPAAPASGQLETTTQAEVINQQVPVWVPPTAIVGQREYAGLLRVTIGVDGRVRAVTLERSTYPSYDALLVRAAKDWTYKPAMRNGRPVESEKTIAFQLRPR